MTEALYDRMNWADIEEITYAEASHPKRILGPHKMEDGWLIQAYVPTAVEMFILIGKKTIPMELADESGFFAGFLPFRIAGMGTPDYRYHITFDDGSTEELGDPYAFPSFYTDEDIRKYQAGIFYDVYDKMGAHPDTIDGVSGVRFSVWAPNAERVSVVGDFNLWDGRRHMMERHGDDGIFELFIPGLPAGTLYKYEIKCRHIPPFLKIDPYGQAFQLRPDNANIVADLRQFTWTDDQWEAKKKERKASGIKEQPVSIYEVDLGSILRKQPVINEDGTVENGSEFYNYRELAEKLADYVKREGYTHVELMPVMEHPLDESWGYQVSGYYAPTSRFGTPADFQYFMNYMHASGIGVILDWVPAHFPKDDWGLAGFDGTLLYENPDPKFATHPHWGTALFNYRRHEVSNFLISSAMFWARVYHADGIRMDAVAAMLYLDYGREGQDSPRNMYGGNENLDAVEFLKHLNTEMRKQYPGVLLIAEESTAWPNVTAAAEDNGLGFDLKWNMGWMNDFLKYMEIDPFFRKGSYQELTFSMLYNYSEDFLLCFSHDEVVHGKRSMLAKMPGETFEEKAENLRAAYGYLYSFPGKKLLFMGQDFGQYDEWSEKQEIEWNLLEYPVHKGIQDYVKDLNALYRSTPALYKFDYYPDGFEWINCSYSTLSLLLYLRKTEKPEETILVAANFDNMAHEKFRVGVPFMCTAKPILCSSDQKYGSNASLRKTTRKAKKQKWDERAYAVDIDIPPMSVTYYQLTPCEEPVEKPKKQTNVKEAKPAAAKKTDIKKKPAAPKREAPKTVKAEPKKSVRAKSKTETKPKKTEKKTAEKPVVTENLAQKATEVTAAAKKTVTKKAAEVTTEAKRVVTKKAADVTRAAKKAAEVSETAKKTVTKKATDMTTAAKKTVAKKAKEKK